MNKWEKYIDDFMYYMKMERNFSKNTINSYLIDCRDFFLYLNENYPEVTPKNIEDKHFSNYITDKLQLLKVSSKKRKISSIRAFFKYLLFAEEIDKDPTQLITTPRMEERLPVVLSNQEIEKMINSIDVSSYSGYRNRLTIEVLYATGLRVSEFVNLQLSDIIFKEGFLDIIGKGNKERYVPICKSALNHLQTYIDNYRSQIEIKPKYKDYVFVNQKRGTNLTRQFIFNLIKKTAKDVGIQKKIHPHILRHSFATELIRNGANIIAVKEMMGHSSIRSTEIYVNLDKKDLKKALLSFHPFYKKRK
jgi:integrase/recombinase XerD